LILSDCKPKSRACIYVQNSLNFSKINCDNDSLEIVCLNFEEFILINYYRTFKPNNNTGLFDHFVEAINVIDNIVTRYPQKFIVIVGDFNLNFKKVNVPTYSHANYFSYFDTVLINHGFVQQVKKILGEEL